MDNMIDKANSSDKDCKKVETEKFSKRLLIALEESEDIINGKIEARRYKNFDELVEYID